MTGRAVLMVAFHFPPMAASSGMHRTLSFARALLARGWHPIILTATRNAYDRTDDEHLPDIPEGVTVTRAPCVDTARHLSVAGRYPGWLARPDRWISWFLSAVPVGLRHAREHQVSALWSTYPIATAHLIGGAIAGRSGLPWIADFRDPMAHAGYPADPAVWQSFLRVEQKTVPLATSSVFATEGAARLYRERYPEFTSRISVIENGYDEDAFTEAERATNRFAPLNPGSMTLLHSGIAYPEWRDPVNLFKAVRALRDEGRLGPEAIRLRFRGSGHDAFIRRRAREYGVEDCVELLAPIPYKDALAEMLRADGLVVLQSNGCNDQVPAKLYEYLRAGRPVIGLSDGETARVLRRFGVEAVAALESEADVRIHLDRFVAMVAAGRAPTSPGTQVLEASRDRVAGRFVDLLDAVVAHKSASATAALP